MFHSSPESENRESFSSIRTDTPMAFRVIEGSASGQASPQPPRPAPDAINRLIPRIPQPPSEADPVSSGLNPSLGLKQPADERSSAAGQTGQTSPPQPEGAGGLQPQPAPPPTPGPTQQDSDATIERLRLELEAARDEVDALHQMLEDLPEIFERKFRERQRAFLDHHEHLLADNRALRDRLYSLNPATPTAQPSLPASRKPSSGRLSRSILSWFGRGSSDPSA